MKSCNLLIAGLVGLATAPTAPAAIIASFDAGLGQATFASPDGSPLPDGNQAWLGAFDTGFVNGGGLNNITGLLDLPTLDANFTTYNTGSIFTINIPVPPTPIVQPGSLGISSNSTAINGSETDTSNFFDGLPVYLWVFDTSDDLAPDPSFSNVAAFGIFGSTDADWTFVDSVTSTSLNSDQIDTAYFGSIDSANGRLVTASDVPAPNPAALVGLGAFGMVLVRRRRTARG